MGSDIDKWLTERALMNELLQHLHRAAERMKRQADKKRSERSFEVGEMVFLKLQPYVQSSVANRANHKLMFKFYGPYKILKRIGAVAYKLELPATSQIHPVFHVSQLKKMLSPNVQVTNNLPSLSSHLAVPVEVLQERWVQKGNKKIQQVLLKWSEETMGEPTWEDLDDLKNRFPRSTAWGQAVLQGKGIVSSPDDMEQVNTKTRPQDGEAQAQAHREPKPNPRYKGSTWTT